MFVHRNFRKQNVVGDVKRFFTTRMKTLRVQISPYVWVCTYINTVLNYTHVTVVQNISIHNFSLLRAIWKFSFNIFIVRTNCVRMYYIVHIWLKYYSTAVSSVSAGILSIIVQSIYCKYVHTNTNYILCVVKSVVYICIIYVREWLITPTSISSTSEYPSASSFGSFQQPFSQHFFQLWLKFEVCFSTLDCDEQFGQFQAPFPC